MYQYILFDLDGTLTDPGLGIINSVSFALGKFGIEVEDKTSLYKFIGPPLVDSFCNFYGFDEAKAMEAIGYYREVYSVTGLFENELYPDIDRMLKTLKERGYKLLLATSKPEEFSVKILEHFDIMKYFDFIGAATMDERRTRKSEVIQYVLEGMDIKDMTQALMVGDRHHDIDGAAVFGIDSVGVTYGYGSRKELQEAGATYVVDNADEILELLAP